MSVIHRLMSVTLFTISSSFRETINTSLRGVISGWCPVTDSEAEKDSQHDNCHQISVPEKDIFKRYKTLYGTN